MVVSVKISQLPHRMVRLPWSRLALATLSDLKIYRLEWTMFAIAATSLASSLSRASLSSLGLGPLGKVTPPWLFVAAEVAVMLPRAIRGHRWYQDKFGLRYPPERKAVIPFVL